MEESAAGAVGLHPFAIDDELWDGAFTDIAQKFFDGAQSVCL